MPTRPTHSSRMSSPPPDNRSSRVPASREFERGVDGHSSRRPRITRYPHPAASPPTSPASGEFSSARMPPPGCFAADLPSEWGGEVLTSFSVLRLPPPGGFAADLTGERGGEVPLGFQLEENCVHDVAETLVGR